MAGDWIKMRVSLSTHPKVLAMAEFLHGHGRYVEWQAPASSIGGVCLSDEDRAEFDALVYAALRVTRYVTVAALLRFWGYANEHADAEFIRGLRLNDIDEITGVPGFGEAMQSVGWASPDHNNGGVRLPNFNEFNSVAKTRSNAAERQRRYRERHSNATNNGTDNATVTRDVTVMSQPREEKIREEKKREKRKEKDSSGKPDPAGFAEWYAQYPRHEGRAKAAEAWLSVMPDPDIVMAAVSWQKRSGCLVEAYAADGRSVIPLPASWLRGRRWEDERPGGAKPKQPCAKCQKPATGWDGAHYCNDHMPARTPAVASLGAHLTTRAA